MPRPDQEVRQDNRWVTVHVWNELEFEYIRLRFKLMRTEPTPKLVAWNSHRPPLIHVISVQSY